MVKDYGLRCGRRGGRDGLRMRSRRVNTAECGASGLQFRQNVGDVGFVEG